MGQLTAQSSGEWNDVTRDPPPRGRVLMFRNARGDEWLAMNRKDDAVAWSFIR